MRPNREPRGGCHFFQCLKDYPVPDVVEFRREGPIAVITVNHPPVNALNIPMRSGLVAALQRAREDKDVEAVVLTAAGRTFIAGADITEFNKPPVPPTTGDVIEALDAMTKPVVAALHGTPLGGGLEVALGCHFRVAAPGTKLGLPEIKLGLMPGAGGTQRLPRAVGKAKAMDMALTARMMNAEEAERAGLVSRVVPLDKLMDETLAAALTICGFGRLATMAAKECVNRAFEGALADGVMFERRLFHALFATADQKEGMDAFVNKRAPQFKNR